jgi:succinoglycan biosynthesis transport protein ExoP
MTLSTSFLIQPPPHQLWPPDAQSGHFSVDDKPDYLSRLWMAVRRYQITALTVVLLGTVLTFVALAVVKPIYSSTATIMIDGRGAQAANVANVVSALPIDLDTATNEVQVLTSRKLVGAVVRELGLENDQAYDPNRGGLFRSAVRSMLDAAQTMLPIWAITDFRQMIERPPLKGREYMDAVIESVENALNVGPVGRSRAISITFSAAHPGTAEEVANTLAQRYLDNQTEVKRRAAQAAYDRINDQLTGLREAAAESSRRVEEFRARSGLVDGRESSLIRQRVSEVSTQLTTAELDVLSVASRLGDVERAAAKSGGDNSTELLKSTLIQQLRLQQFQITRDASMASAAYSGKYPGGDAVSTQLGVIQKRIDEEALNIVASIRGEYQAAIMRENGLRAQLDSLKAEMARLRGSEVTLNQLEQDSQAAGEIYDAYLRRAKQTAAGTTVESPDAYIISNATIPSQPISPNKKVLIPVGIVMSFALALVVVLVLDAREPGLENPAQVARMLGLSTLAMIPKQDRPDRVPGPDSPIGNAITDLLMRVVVVPGNKCILVTSALALEGKTSVSLALARIAAASGQKTLLVDCDVRRRHQGLSMRGVVPPGLAEVLDGHVALEEMVIGDTIVDGLSVLTTEAYLEGPSQPICSAGLRELLKMARRSFDVIVIDAPPVLARPDAWMLALLADTTLLAVQWSRTPSQAVLEAYRKLAEMGAKVSGVVLTMVDTKRIPYYWAPAVNEHAKEPTGTLFAKGVGGDRAPQGTPRARQSNGTTKRELYELAKAKGVPGRSKMNKRELEDALQQG